LPIYEYRCANGHEFEVMQSMGQDPIAVCQQCGASVERVFRPIAVHFKGSGFYTTDYGRGRSGAEASSDSAGGDAGNGSKTESGESKKSDESKKSSESTKSGDGAKKADSKSESSD